MLDLLWRLFSFFIAFSLLVGIHEFGHFWVARRLGIQVIKFSIGFGRPIYQWVGRDNIQYAVGWLFLGGYVRMLDSREHAADALSVQEVSRAFDHQPVLNRMAVVLAGPFVNLLLGIGLYATMGFWGIPQIHPTIGKVLLQSPAAQTQLSAHQVIVSVDGVRTSHWGAVVRQMALRLGEKGYLTMSTRDSVDTPDNTVKVHRITLDQWQVNAERPRLLQSLGIVPFYPDLPAIIGEVKPGKSADKAGIQVGDRIRAISGEPVQNWVDFVRTVSDLPSKTVDLTIERNQTVLNKSVQIGWQIGAGWKRVGTMGVNSLPIQWPTSMQFEERYPFFRAFLYGLSETWHLAHFNYVIIFKMISGKVSLKTLGGPISLFKMADIAWHRGLLAIGQFLAIISIMLACINLLPIPALDGGHFFLLILEAIRGKALKSATEVLITRLGFIFLIVIMVQATINDLLR